MEREEKHMIDDDATQFSYFRDNELTQLAGANIDESSSEKHKALEEGTLFLNKYKILKVIGEGSFSLIYLLEANDASKKLLVAKEFFPKGFVTRNSANEVILKTSLSEKEIENYHFMKDIFVGEAQNLVKVSSRTHPNVLNFFSLEENVNNTMYLITDYEEGVTLKEYMRQRQKEYKGKLSNQEVVHLLQGLLSGLEHIHNVKIYHQDIKLENILIRHDHTPLLLDFGASVVLYDEKRKKYFNATTPRYAAPEQIELSQPPSIDQRSDIYALGVLAYKLVTDTFPPKASERLKALDEQHNDPYIPLEIQKTYGYDMVLLKSIDKALHLLPEQRFQNTKEFKNALSQKKILNTLPLPKLLLGLLLPLIGLLLYFIWPTSQGTAKLNLKEKTYFVYSDGKKIPISEEKTILLSTGRHKLTIIKDGYIPYEVNITIEANKITNVTADLMPSTHLIQLSSNIDNATFIVNNKPIQGDTFQGQYGEKYTIKTIALNHPVEIVESDYVQLSQNHFRFYQKLKQKNKIVHIKINQPLDIGETVIKVNNQTITGNTFEVGNAKKYNIFIQNPYYKPIRIEKKYNELINTPMQEFTLKQGEGKVIVKGLEPGVKIEAYQKNNNILSKTDANIEYKNGDYIVRTKAYPKLYFNFSKKGYAPKTTSLFSLENNTTLYQESQMSKTKIVQSTIPVIPSSTETLSIIKPIKQAEVVKKIKSKTRPNKKTVVIKKVKSKTKPSKRVTRTKKRSKKVKDKKQYKRKLYVPAKSKKIVKKSKLKPKSKRTRRGQKKSLFNKGHLWYCTANNNRGGVWSAKRQTRSSAYSSALRKCRTRHNNFCTISNCYLWSD